MRKKISYIHLQKKYKGKIVALNKEETQIVALVRTVAEVEKKAQQGGWDPEELVFCGPVEKAGKVSVYL